MNEAGRINVAADWLLRLQSETASDELIHQWVQWCEADVRNQQAFDRVRELLKVADGLADEVRDGELIGAAEVSNPVERTVQSGWRARWQRPLRALAASLAILAVGALLWAVLIGTGQLPVLNGSVIASNAPVRDAMLPDGSKVAIASKSTVAVSYTDDTRALELRDGEAFFAVTPNKHRPFIVTAAGVSVRAVGTAFNVRRAAERVVVTVTEGTVDVYRQGQEAAPVRASAGSQVAWHVGTRQRADAAVSDEPVMTSVNPTMAMGWREGRLEYRNEPLDAVVADINRYATRPVVIADDSVRKLRFSGTVMVELTDEWLGALPKQFPVTLERENGVDMIHGAVSSPAH
jgi:transmembrane sensor